MWGLKDERPREKLTGQAVWIMCVKCVEKWSRRSEGMEGGEEERSQAKAWMLDGRDEPMMYPLLERVDERRDEASASEPARIGQYICVADSASSSRSIAEPSVPVAPVSS